MDDNLRKMLEQLMGSGESEGTILAKESCMIFGKAVSIAASPVCNKTDMTLQKKGLDAAVNQLLDRKPPAQIKQTIINGHALVTELMNARIATLDE
jgi:hypothetical protein